MGGSGGGSAKLAKANVAIVAGVTLLPLATVLLAAGLYSRYVLCRSSTGCTETDLLASSIGVPVGVLLMVAGTAMAAAGLLVRADLRRG